MQREQGKILVLTGRYVNIRTVTPGDAEFILSLRCNQEKAKYLHKTEYNIKKQEEYIQHALSLDNEWYFIIENKIHKPLGTYRIYDLKPDSFGIGSWLMIDGCSYYETIEGEYLVKTVDFKKTGFNKFHFDVRKENKKVIRFHKLMGARQIGETEQDIFFECTKDDYLNNVSKILKFKSDLLCT